MYMRISRPTRIAIAVLVIGVVAVVGVYLLNASRAATPFISKEGESGTVTAPAISVNDANASAGKAIKFTPDTLPPEDILNVSYGSNSQQKFDIHRARNGQVAPAVMMVHGGGWANGDKSEKTEYAKKLAANGFTVFNVNYRLASSTQVGYPAQVDDLKAVAAFIKANGPQYRADPNDINMVGGSAGAHLVMLTSLQMNKATAGSIKAVAEMSGPTDFMAPGTSGPVQGFLGCNPTTQCSDALKKEASPLWNVGPSCPAMYVMHSNLEAIPVSQAQDMYDKLIAPAAGCDAKLNRLSGSLHAFAYWDQVETSIIQWLNAH